jgi:hypothetical protein
MAVAVGDAVTLGALGPAVALCAGEVFAGEQATTTATRSPAAAIVGRCRTIDGL